MPVYEYQCPACGVFEESHSLADNPRIVPCPQCHADAPKIISAVLGRSTSTSTRTLGNAVEQAEGTPRVVTGTPSSQPARITHNPQHRFLPKP